MSGTASTIWEALHWGTGLCSPQPVRSARIHAPRQPGDEAVPPDDSTVKIQEVYFNSKDRWYVKIRLNYGELPRRHHVKTGFYTQDEAHDYLEKYVQGNGFLPVLEGQ